FMNRVFNEDHLKVCQLVKRLNKPLWLDYDDFLFDVPKDNPNYHTYMNEKAHTCLIGILSLADTVSVSTRTLKALYEKEIDVGNGQTITLAKNVICIPNAYDPKFHGAQVSSNGNKLITWRGSKTHERDLMEFADPIIQFMKENKDWKIEFLGYNPWQITEQIDHSQVSHSKSREPFEYMDYLKHLNPSIHIVPLHDSLFNRSKSNIAWIEATCAGAMVIAPDWDGWINTGYNYSDKGTFFRYMS